MVNAQGRNPAEFGVRIDEDRFRRLVKAGKDITLNHFNRTTIQSYHNILLWQPSTVWQYLDPTPVMSVTPELDELSPPALQRARFEKLKDPKRYQMAMSQGPPGSCCGRKFPRLHGDADRLLL